MTRRPCLSLRSFFTVILFKLCPRRHNIITQRGLFCSLFSGSSSPAEYLAYLFICFLQRSLSPRSSRSHGHAKRRIIACLSKRFVAHPIRICYLHVLRPLRTYCSAATRLYNEIVALVSLIVTEVGLVQGGQTATATRFWRGDREAVQFAHLRTP